MTRQQKADAAESAVVRRYETRKAIATAVAEIERRANAETRLDLALRWIGHQAI